MKPKYKKKRSGLEEKFAEVLRSQNIHYDYEGLSIKYKVSKVKFYKPDFILSYKYKDKEMLIETKGWFTSVDRQKLIYVLESNPGIDLRLVFEKDNKLNRKSNTRYSDWAKKHGIKYHVGIGIPDEWLNELREK